MSISVCANCGAVLGGAFCAACGQQATSGRLTVRDVMRRLATRAFDLDRGILHTALSLLRHPGSVAADYVRGRTAPYTNPVKYFLIALSLVQVVAIWAGHVGDFASGLTDGANGDALQGGAAEAAEFLDRYFVLLTAPAVPLLAGVQRMVFRRGERNYAEGLVFALFVSAQLLLLWLLLAFASDGLGIARTWPPLLAGAAAAWGYHAWAASDFFRLRRWPALVRSAAALALAGIAYTIAFTALLGLFLL